MNININSLKRGCPIKWGMTFCARRSPPGTESGMTKAAGMTNQLFSVIFAESVSHGPRPHDVHFCVQKAELHKRS